MPLRGWGVGGGLVVNVLSETPWLTSTRAPVRGSSSDQDAAPKHHFQSGGGLFSVSSHTGRLSLV